MLAGPIEFEWLALGAVLVAFAAVLQQYRWYLLVRGLDLPTTVRNAYRLGFVSVFYNTFLPGSVGGDFLKAYFIAHAHPERKTRAIASVVADRVLGLYGLVMFVAVLGSIAWALGDPRIAANPDLQWIVKVMAVFAAAIALGFLMLGFLPPHRVDRFANRLKAVPKLGASLSELWYAVWEYRKRLKVVVDRFSALSLAPRTSTGVCVPRVASRVFPPGPT